MKSRTRARGRRVWPRGVPVGMGRYIKTAFVQPWNLLLFFGAVGFALLSGRPDVFLPLVLAAEVGYLGLLGTHPRFKAYVDAREAATRQVRPPAVDPQQRVERMLKSLPAETLRRFENLQQRCKELREIARRLRDPHAGGGGGELEQMQLAGLNKLLWIFLRLLYTQHALEQFLRRTDEREIRAGIAELERKLAALSAGEDDPARERRRRVLSDNLQTFQTRLANLAKARENHELVQLELDSLENKIRSLGEMAINCHEPEFLSGRVEEVIEGMVQTERTMSELQFLTGLEADVREAVPELVRRPVVEQSSRRSPP